MKKLLLFFAVGICFLSCSKETTKFLYSLNVSSDSVALPNAIKVDVAKTAGDDDVVTLSVEGLPDYISSDLGYTSPVTPFSTTIHFRLSTLAEADVATWKSYTVTVKARSSKGIERSEQITFFCFPEDATAPFDNGYFTFMESCAVSGSERRGVTMVSNGAGGVLMDNFFNTLFGKYTVPAIINAHNRTITIPAFTQDNYTFKGVGNFYKSGDTLGCTIHFSRSTVSTFDTCTAYLVKSL